MGTLPRSSLLPPPLLTSHFSRITLPRRPSMPSSPAAIDAQALRRAELTRGVSQRPIYEAIAREIRAAGWTETHRAGLVADIGCGRGELWESLAPLATEYLGIDLVRHEGFPPALPWRAHDLQLPGLPLDDATCDLAVACEVIPCLENPWLLFREMARIVRPGGAVVVTTNNCESLVSLLLLALRGRHRAYGDDTAAFMITPSLARDLLRMATAAGLRDARIFYTSPGRIPGTARAFPAWLARLAPRRFSDNFGVLARR